MADIIVTNQGHKIQCAVKVTAASVRVPYTFKRISAALAFVGILLNNKGTPAHLTCDQYYFKVRQGEVLAEQREAEDGGNPQGSEKIREAGPDKV